MKFGIFSNNTLKIVACISMLIDHIGAILFPNVYILRIIGRVAFPVFAFLLAEGCFYTRNKFRHLFVISFFAIVMQVVLFIATKMIDFNIFIHFSIGVFLCYIINDIEKLIKRRKILLCIFLTLLFIAVIVLLICIDKYTTYFFSNYGIYGILLPVVLYLIKKYLNKIHIYFSIIAICICCVLMHYFTPYFYQLFGMISCCFIILYNGKKGKYNLKYLFYFFYPLHMVILYGISLLIGG